MQNRRNGNRLALDEAVEMTLLEPELPHSGLVADELSYEFGRKYGIYLNLLVSGLRFTGNIDLPVGQKISFRIPGEPDILKGNIVWKKPLEGTGAAYGVKVSLGVNRRRSDREDLEDAVEMELIEPVAAPETSFIIEEMSYGMGRKHGVHSSPHISGLRFRSGMNLSKGQEIIFKVPSYEEVLRGTIVWSEKIDSGNSRYGVQIG